MRETNGGGLAEHKVMHFECHLVEGRPKMRMAGLVVLLIGGLGLAGCGEQTASVTHVAAKNTAVTVAPSPSYTPALRAGLPSGLARTRPSLRPVS